MMSTSTKPIVFFDGFCGTCNAFVDFILKVDTEGKLMLAPIQGETARNKLSKDVQSSLSTIVLSLPNGEFLIKSAAVWAIFAQLPFPWRVVSFLSLIPRPVADLGYSLVAWCRYVIGGKRDSCRIPSGDERQRFMP